MLPSSVSTQPTILTSSVRYLCSCHSTPDTILLWTVDTIPLCQNKLPNVSSDLHAAEEQCVCQVPEHKLGSPLDNTLVAMSWAPSHQVHQIFSLVALKIPGLQRTQESHRRLAQWGHESFQAKYSERSAHSCWEVDFLSIAPSSGSEPFLLHYSLSGECQPSPRPSNPAQSSPHLQPGMLQFLC